MGTGSVWFRRVASDEFSPAFERRGDSPPQGCSVASATAECRGDSSVANATLSFRTVPSRLSKAGLNSSDATRRNQTEPGSLAETSCGSFANCSTLPEY